MEINAGFLPMPLHGALRYTSHGGDFGEGEAAEEFQIDNLGEPGVDLRELVESVADARQFAVVDGVLRTSVPSEVISNWPPRFWARRLRA